MIQTKNNNALLFFITFFIIGYNIFVSLLGLGVTYIYQWISLLCLGYWAVLYLSHSAKNVYLNVSLVVFISIFIYSLFSEFVNDQFRSLSFSLLISIPFYFYKFNPKHINKFFLLLCVISIASEFLNLNQGREEFGEGYYGGGYFALVTLPVGLYILRNKNEITKALWCIFVFILVLYSVKRGDILGYLVGVAFYYLAILFRQRKKNRIWLIITAGIMLAALYAVFQYGLDSSELLQRRLESTEEGGGSGRDVIYLSLWNTWINSDVFNQLFGYGINAPFRLIGIQAHNDWLELLLDMGLVGVSLYLTLFFSLIRSFTRKQVPVELRPIFFSILGIWLVKSSFSMFLFSTPTVMLSMIIGYMLNPNVNHFAIAKTRKA